MKNYLLDRAYQDSQIGLTALKVLVFLVRLKTPWEKNQQELANTLGVDRSGLNQSLKWLEKKEYLQLINLSKNGFVVRKRIVLKNGN